jgi:hypothetical protein
MNNAAVVKTLLGEALDNPWSKAIEEYTCLLQLKESIQKVFNNLNEREKQTLFPILSQMREEERRNLELRASLASKRSPIDVTEEHRLSEVDLAQDFDPSLRRIAVSNCKKVGRKLLKKHHPDMGGDPEVFDLCKKAIDSGDVELVQILMYRTTGESPVSPELVAQRVRVRTVKLQGSRLYGAVRLFVSDRDTSFLNYMENLLRSRLRDLQMMNIPGAFEASIKEYHDEEPDSI